MLGRWLLLSLTALSHGLHLISGVGECCRHSPRCTQYARQAIERHGLLRGGWLAAKRLLKCGPWGTFGEDPVPESTGK